MLRLHAAQTAFNQEARDQESSEDSVFINLVDIGEITLLLCLCFLMIMLADTHVIFNF